TFCWATSGEMRACASSSPAVATFAPSGERSDGTWTVMASLNESRSQFALSTLPDLERPAKLVGTDQSAAATKPATIERCIVEPSDNSVRPRTQKAVGSGQWAVGSGR